MKDNNNNNEMKNTCKVCGEEKNISELHLNDFQLNYCQTPSQLLKRVVCKKCFKNDIKERNKNYFAKKAESWKKYQKEYQNKRRKDIKEKFFDYIKIEVNKKRGILGLPDEVWCDHKKQMERGVVMINKDYFIDYFIKNNIEFTMQSFIEKFDGDIRKALKFFRKHIRITSRQTMLINRRPQTIEKKSEKEIEMIFQNKIKKNDINSMKVICTYLYFINNNQILNKKIENCILDQDYIVESNLFSIRKIIANKKVYNYILTSMFAKKYIIKHFEINSNNFNEKEKEITGYIRQYLFEVFQNEKDVDLHIKLFTSGLKSLYLTFFMEKIVK